MNAAPFNVSVSMNLCSLSRGDRRSGRDVCDYAFLSPTGVASNPSRHGIAPESMPAILYSCELVGGLRLDAPQTESPWSFGCSDGDVLVAGELISASV